MTVSLAACLVVTHCLNAQAMYAGPGETLMRPLIPDPFLIKQGWVWSELQLSPDEAKSIQEAISEEFKRIRGQSVASAAPMLEEFNKKYQGRLLELSIWVNDVFALTNKTVTTHLGLAPSQIAVIDEIAQQLYLWKDAEWKRLNGYERRDIHTRIEHQRAGKDPVEPDPIQVLERTAKTHHES